MSGSRTAINLGNNNNPSARELVYCHACNNEFYRDGPTGLTCPQCESDFTEVIDPDFDPRTEMEEDEDDTALRSHNPWAIPDPNADPEEDDIENHMRRPFYPPGFGRIPGGQSQYPPYQQPPFPSQQQPFPHTGLRPEASSPLFADFATMLQNITAGRIDANTLRRGTAMPDSPYSQPQPGQNRSPLGSQQPPRGPAPATGPRVSMWTTSGPGYTVTATSSGGFHQFRTSGSTGTQREMGGMGGMGGVDALPNLLNSLLQGMDRAPNGPFAGGQSLFPPGSRQPGDGPSEQLANLIQHINNLAASGSQEVVDRIMSETLEHAISNAPGPASEAAINALPRRKVTKSMKEGESKLSECSICMDEVSVGEDVVDLPCNHWFHFQCVEAWLKEHDTCPVCRRGITPREGDRNTARSPTEEPLHNQDPFVLARQQSGSREHPFVVPESPTADRRRPHPSRAPSSSRRQSDSGNDRVSGGGGVSGRRRSFFGGSGGNNNNG